MWGFTGILGKLIDLDSFVLVWYRVWIAAIGLGIGMLYLKKSFRLMSSRQLLYIVGVGILVALHWVTFFKSIQLSTASLGILCLSTVTLHVTWLEPIIMRKKFSWLEFIFGLLVIFGIYFVSEDFSAKEYEALAYGLVSALCAALFAVFNAKLAEKNTSSQISFYEMLTGTIFLSIVLLFQGKFSVADLEINWLELSLLIFLGLFCTSFAFLATIEVVKKLGAFTVSLAINLEPVYTILLAIVILKENESLNKNFYIGSAVIVLVVIVNALSKQYLRAKTRKNEELNFRKIH